MAANQHGMHAARHCTVTKRPSNCQPATWRLSMRQHKRRHTGGASRIREAQALLARLQRIGATLQAVCSPVSVLSMALQATLTAFSHLGMFCIRHVDAVGAGAQGVGALFLLLTALLQAFGAHVRAGGPGR